MIATPIPDPGARADMLRFTRLAQVCRRMAADWQHAFNEEVHDVRVDRLGFAVVMVYDLVRARRHWEIGDGFGRALMAALRSAIDPDVGLILRQAAAGSCRARAGP